MTFVPDAIAPPSLPLDELEVELEAELKAVRAIKSHIKELAEVLREFPHLRKRYEVQLAELTESDPAPTPSISFVPTPTFDSTEPATKEDDATNPQKIVAFFQARGNRPATTAEIRKATGIGDSSVRNVLYLQASEFFVKGRKVKGQVLWKLKDEPPDPDARDEFADL